MQKILMTGTGGFIFSNALRSFIYQKAPYEISSVDKIVNSSLMNNIFQHKIHDFHIADICDEHIMDRIFEFIKPDIIIHGAAEANVDKSISDPNIFIKSNILGTQNLINLAIKYKTKLFLYQSTDEVLGSLDEGKTPWKEDAPFNPRNAYSASKASGELLLQAAHNTHGLDYIIVRSCNNMGYRQDPSKLIPRTIKCIRDKTTIPVYGNGMQSREWIHTMDNSQAILTILQKGEKNNIYNISSGEERNNLEVIYSICDMLGAGRELVKSVPDRLGHDKRYALDNSKLKALGWTPRYKTFEDMLKNTIDWYQSNPYFLNSI